MILKVALVLVVAVGVLVGAVGFLIVVLPPIVEIFRFSKKNPGAPVNPYAEASTSKPEKDAS